MNSHCEDVKQGFAQMEWSLLHRSASLNDANEKLDCWLRPNLKTWYKNFPDWSMVAAAYMLDETGHQTDDLCVGVMRFRSTNTKSEFPSDSLSALRVVFPGIQVRYNDDGFTAAIAQ